MIKLNLPKNYSLYEVAYGSDQPFEQLYLILFESLPSKYLSRTNYGMELIDYLKNDGFVEIVRNENSRKYSNLPQFLSGANENTNEEKILVNQQKQIMIKFQIKKDDKTIYTTASFLYNLNNGDINQQIDFISLKTLEKQKQKASINLVKSDMGHLDTEEYNLTIPDIDLELNYGQDFVKVHDLIIKRLNTDSSKGIILLHGDPGTGKTSYIKYITKLITEKEILFIPPSMAEMLSEPSIIPFLMEHKNSILIIEDAERVISDREINGSSAGVSNILNLTDGILGDCLNIQIIATFNMKKEKIDQALLRKGRLIAEHKFTNLSVQDTNKLLKSLNKDFVSDKEMSLADIYNVDGEFYKTKSTNSKIGF